MARPPRNRRPARGRGAGSREARRHAEMKIGARFDAASPRVTPQWRGETVNAGVTRPSRGGRYQTGAGSAWPPRRRR
jgi:hypothetical protein